MQKMEEWTLAIGDVIVGLDIGTSKVSLVIGEVNNFNQIEIQYTASHKCKRNQKSKDYRWRRNCYSCIQSYKRGRNRKWTYN